jgi:hypothetical protein
MIGTAVFFIAVNCTFGTTTLLANGVPVWRQSVQGEPLYATVSLNPWLTARQNTLSLVLSDIPDRALRAGGCQYVLSKRSSEGLAQQGSVVWTEADAVGDALTPRSWQLPVELPAGSSALPSLPGASLGKPQVEEAATRAVLALHVALAAGRTEAALALLQGGLDRQAVAHGVPEKLYREGVAQVMKRILAGQGQRVADLNLTELEFLHGPGDVVLVQRRGYGRSPLILMNSSAGELAGDVHWLGGAQGGLMLDVTLVPEAVQWQH